VGAGEEEAGFKAEEIEETCEERLEASDEATLLTLLAVEEAVEEGAVTPGR
jgi:hypothetical protein